MRLVDLFVGEGALQRLIADGEGQRLLARRNLLSAVDIEQRDLVYQWEALYDLLHSACGKAVIYYQGYVAGITREAGDGTISVYSPCEGQQLHQVYFEE